MKLKPGSIVQAIVNSANAAKGETGVVTRVFADEEQAPPPHPFMCLVRWHSMERLSMLKNQSHYEAWRDECYVPMDEIKAIGYETR